MKTFKEYKPVGFIKQLAATKPNYSGKNPAGGRKIPQGTIGAAHRNNGLSKWENGGVSSDDVRVRLTTPDLRDNPDQLTIDIKSRARPLGWVSSK